MNVSFTDEHKIWVIFDTCTRPSYYQDLHNLLAAPPNWILRYDYQKKYISDDVLSALLPENKLPRYILFAYAQAVSYKRGNEPPKEALEFEKIIWLPTRIGEMLNVVQEGDNFFLDFKLLNYPRLRTGIETVFRVPFDKHETPFWKWVIFSPADENFSKMMDGSAEENWHEIVERLFQFPMQFAGDVFWRVASVKESGSPTTLEVVETKESHEQQIRQLKSHYRLKETCGYAAEIVTKRSPSGRTATAPTQFRVTAQSSDAEALRVVGSGDFDVRQYTGHHLEFESRPLAGLGTRLVELRLLTLPRDGDWPQGPELHLRFEISRRWVLAFIGLLAMALGVVLGTASIWKLVDNGEPFFILGLFAGVFLTAMGATLWTGKLVSK